MKEKEEQRYGRNKETIVDKSYLMSGEFRKKFDAITDSAELNRLLYRLAKKMLIHRSGTKYEDMYWIDPETNHIVAEEISCDEEEMIVYSKATRQTVREKKGLITIHSHPCSFPPSIEDLNSNFLREYSTGIVVGHDGKVFLYGCFEFVSESYYELKVAEYGSRGYNIVESQINALRDCEMVFDCYVKEVTGNDI